MAHHNIKIPEKLDFRYDFPAKAKRFLFILAGVGIVLIILGLLFSGGGHGQEHATEGAHHASPLAQRFWGTFLAAAFMFTAVGLIGLFFTAIQTVTNAYWYVLLKRTFEAIGTYVVVGVVTLILVLFGAHVVYHWLDAEAVQHDLVLKAKSGMLNFPAFLIRSGIIFAVWILFLWIFRRMSAQEDKMGSVHLFNKSMFLSGVFLFVYAVSFSFFSWDWLMSVNPHWYSTMFAVHTFASAFVTMIAVTILIAVHLYSRGYLPVLNMSHFHDLGKFLFAFSIFWMYIWFGQYFLIWYANIPEETQWFMPQLQQYGALFFFNIFLNFIVPFLALMTNSSKRNLLWLSVISGIVIFGHWLDFYLMVIPNLTKGAVHFGLFEIGMFLLFAGIFGFVVLQQLSKRYLIPQQHPYLEESITHHYDI